MTGSIRPPDPAANPVLVGHAAAEALLLRAWQAGRLPHAWLFRGPRGVGKATLAFRFARRLLAGPADSDRAASDPTHPVFRMVASGAHPDLQVLRRVPNPKTGKLYKEILIEQVRAADAALHATAARAGHKVLIVDPADEFSDSAANALLKLLEEPPAGVVLLVVCQRPGMVPRTILSRCAQVTLAPLPLDQARSGIAQLAPSLGEAEIEILAELGEGGIGRALSLADADWLGLYADLLQKLAVARDSEAARLTLALQLMPKGDGGFRGTADLLGFVLRRLARLQADIPPARELFEGEGRALRTLTAGHGLDHWIALWDKLQASTLRVEALNLDPLQILIPLVQGICGTEPDTGLSLA